MNCYRMYNPVLYLADINGNPSVGGKLYFFEAGTSIPATTYKNSEGTEVNTNPVILNERGESVVFLRDGYLYKVVFKDQYDNVVWEQDEVSAPEGGGGGSEDGVTRDDLKPLTLKKGNNVFGTYNPLEQKTIDIPDSIRYVSEQTPNLYRVVADMLIADIMPVLMRSDTDPNVQGVTRDHYYYPAARTGVNSDYEFIGYDGDRVEVATVHQDNSVTYSVKPNGVHRLAQKYVEVDGEDVMTLGDGDRCSGAEPNGETVTKSELLAWLDAGETLIFSFYGFGNYQKRWGIAENVILGGSGSNRYVSADFYVRTVDEYLFEHYHIYTTGDSEFVTLQQYQSISNETTANKVQTLDDSGSHYPSCPAVKSYVAGAMPAASTATPAMDGVASAGSSTSWARGDHVHPTDSSREAVANKTQTLDPTSTTDYPSSAAAANFVNSSVATNTANFLGSFTLSNLGLTYPATDVQIASAFNSHTWPAGVTPTNNDYVYVEIQNPQTTGVDDKVERFKYSSLLASWGYEYTLNNSSFTAAEMAALESGIDSSKVSAYDAAVGTLASHVADTSNPHNVTKLQVGLGSVVNSGDSATPVEGGTTKFTTGGAYTELAKKVDKESGKGLSSNDFTNAYKSDIDNNSAARHTHSAGTGLKSSLTSGVVTTSTNVERLSSSANVSLPENSFSIVEMTDAATNLPQSGYCHILTSQGYDPTYTVQLSLGMTYDGAFLRKKYAGTWGAWVRLMDMAEHGQRVVFWNDASSYAGGNSNRYFRLATISSESLQYNINNVWRAIVSTDSVIEVAYLRLKVRLNAAGSQPVGNLNVSPIGTWSGAVSFTLVLRGVVGNVAVDIWVHHEGGYRSTVISDMGGGSFNLTDKHKNNWTYTSYNNDGSSSIPTDADTQIINAVVD